MIRDPALGSQMQTLWGQGPALTPGQGTNKHILDTIGAVLRKAALLLALVTK